MNEVLRGAEGVEILGDRGANRWPMPLGASGKDQVFVGRIRRDQSQDNTLDVWVVGDQIRKGAALNAVQIAEKMFLSVVLSVYHFPRTFQSQRRGSFR